MKHITIIFALVFLLAACGGAADEPATTTDDTNTTSDTTADEPERVTGLVIPDDVAAPEFEGVNATVTGALEGDASQSTGISECDNGVIEHRLALVTMNSEGIGGNWGFYLPQNLEPGTYELGEFGQRGNDNVVVISATLDDASVEDAPSYSDELGGTVEIIEAGEMVSGRFIMEIASDDTDDTATATGNFMLSADECAEEAE